MKKKGYCRFYRELYWGDSVKKHSLVKWRLTNGRIQPNIYCILKPYIDSDQLDIMNCAFLKQPYYAENPAYIYGIAGSRDEALELLVKISDEAVKAGFEGRVREYLDYLA
jgi:hypothetical protein